MPYLRGRLLLLVKIRTAAMAGGRFYLLHYWKSQYDEIERVSVQEYVLLRRASSGIKSW